MHLFQLVFLLGAGFLAGTVNSIAGGGTLISFPALLIVGYSPVVANVTNSVASWPGYVGGTFGYRSQLAQQRSRLVLSGTAAIVGAVIGTIILLLAPTAIFSEVVPFLVLGSCALLGFQRSISDWIGRIAKKESSGASLAVAIALSAVYGSYFGAGLGIVLLAVFSIFSKDSIQNNNAAKIVMSLVIATVGDIIYIVFAHVAFVAVAVMAGGFLGGGLLGVKIAKRLPASILRWSVITYGTIVGLILLFQNVTQR